MTSTPATAPTTAWPKETAAQTTGLCAKVGNCFPEELSNEAKLGSDVNRVMAVTTCTDSKTSFFCQFERHLSFIYYFMQP